MFSPHHKIKAFSPWRRVVSALRHAADEVIPSERSMHDSLERRIHIEQLRLCFGAAEKLVIIGPLFAGALMIFLAPWVGATTLFTFFISQIAGTIWYYLFQKRLAAQRDLSAGYVRNMRHYLLISLYFTVSFHSFVIWGWVEGDLANHYLIVAALAGSVGLGILMTNPSWGVFLTYFVPLGAFAVLGPLREPDLLHIGISCGSLVYLVLAGRLARKVHEGTRAAIWLRLQLEEHAIELEQARERAEMASLAKSRFLANMSHELRTPLNAIIGFSELVTASLPPGERNADYARHIYTSGQHLLLLINDVLDLSKIEAGRYALDESDIAIRDLIDETARMTSVRADQVGVTLKVDVAPRLPWLHGDERAIRQIVLNLLSNALKFTPKDGTVTVFARLTDGNEMELGVRDTGAGIPQDQLKVVFDRFGQARHDIRVAERGTGLGLPIVKGLAEAHGGRVELTSKLREGTTVTITFPQVRLRIQTKSMRGAAA